MICKRLLKARGKSHYNITFRFMCCSQCVFMKHFLIQARCCLQTKLKGSLQIINSLIEYMRGNVLKRAVSILIEKKNARKIYLTSDMFQYHLHHPNMKSSQKSYHHKNINIMLLAYFYCTVHVSELVSQFATLFFLLHPVSSTLCVHFTNR